MAARCTVGRIPSDSGPRRARGAGQKKEEMEGVPFYRLPMAGRHYGGGNLVGKRRRRFCLWRTDRRRSWQGKLGQQHRRGGGVGQMQGCVARGARAAVTQGRRQPAQNGNGALLRGGGHKAW
jgi:hypothetical protein